MLNTSDYIDRIARPLYFIALLLVLTPLADFVTSVWPVQLAELRWRFASTAMLAGFLFTPLIGSLIGVAISTVLEQKMVLRVIGIINVVSAVILVVLLAIFAFDTLQLRRAVPPDTQNQFKVSAVRTALKLIATIMATGWLGFGGIKLSRTMGSVQAARQKPRMSGPIVTGAGR